MLPSVISTLSIICTIGNVCCIAFLVFDVMGKGNNQCRRHYYAFSLLFTTVSVNQIDPGAALGGCVIMMGVRLIHMDSASS